MQMRTRRTIAGLTVAFIVFAAAYVSAQQAAVPGQDVKSLTGKWVGWATPTSGSNVPIEVEVRPDGSYTSMMGATTGSGTIMVDRGKLLADGHITGSGAPAAGTGRAELTVSTKDGKQMISGVGRDERGPYNFRLMKQ